MTEAAVVMGLPIDVDPLDALLQCVRIAAGEVQYTTLRVAQLEEEQATVTHVEKVEGYTEKGDVSTTKTTTQAELHIWIRARQESMDRLARYSKMAIDAGIAERQVKIAETMGGLIGNLIEGILSDLGLNEDQASAAPLIVHKHLQLLEGGKA